MRLTPATRIPGYPGYIVEHRIDALGREWIDVEEIATTALQSCLVAGLTISEAIESAIAAVSVEEPEPEPIYTPYDLCPDEDRMKGYAW